jgi:Fic family protein
MTNTDILALGRASSVKGVSPKATRAAQLRRMLSRKGGATIAQVQEAFSWQPHTARAAISSLRKAGAMIERKGTSKGSVYRINQEVAAK